MLKRQMAVAGHALPLDRVLLADSIPLLKTVMDKYKMESCSLESWILRFKLNKKKSFPSSSSYRPHRAEYDTTKFWEVLQHAFEFENNTCGHRQLFSKMLETILDGDFHCFMMRGRFAGGGARYVEMCDFFDRHSAVLQKRFEAWMENICSDKTKFTRMLTSTGSHWVFRSTNPTFLDNMLVEFPASGKVRKDQQGVYVILKQLGWPHKAITLTWLVCYLAGHRIDTSKEGWQDFQCSHCCCDLKANGEKIENARCIDPRCLFFESAADNQSRARRHCHCKCRCGCGKSVCEVNGCHSPPCSNSNNK
jgi:hypothetical protein